MRSGRHASSGWQRYRVPSMQPAGRDTVLAHAAALDQDAANRRAHWPALRIPAEWDSGLYPDRQHASGPPRWGERSVPHQRVDCVTQFQLVATCEQISRGVLAPGHPAAVGWMPACHHGISCRQRTISGSQERRADTPLLRSRSGCKLTVRDPSQWCFHL